VIAAARALSSRCIKLQLPGSRSFRKVTGNRKQTTLSVRRPCKAPWWLQVRLWFQAWRSKLSGVSCGLQRAHFVKGTNHEPRYDLSNKARESNTRTRSGNGRNWLSGKKQGDLESGRSQKSLRLRTLTSSKVRKRRSERVEPITQQGRH